jgi:hypothetical protein
LFCVSTVLLFNALSGWADHAAGMRMIFPNRVQLIEALPYIELDDVGGDVGGAGEPAE